MSEPVAGDFWQPPNQPAPRKVLFVHPEGSRRTVYFEEGPPYVIEGQVSPAEEQARLLAARAIMDQRISQRREVAIASGMMTPYGRVQTDAQSARNIAGLASTALNAKVSGQPFTARFRMENNAEVELGADALIALGQLFTAHVSACYDWSWVLKAQVQAAGTVEAVYRINIEDGWPA